MDIKYDNHYITTNTENQHLINASQLSALYDLELFFVA